MGARREELGALSGLAWPIVLTNLGTMAMGVVDTLMIGHLDDPRALAAAALGNVLAMGTMLLGMGVIFGIDPIVTRAHGARDGARAGLALQRGLVLALFVGILIVLVWTRCKGILVTFRQDPATAEISHGYIQVQLWSVVPFLWFVALRQYLQGRGILAPILWVVVGANLINALLNWALIYGHLGLPPLGVRGAGIATAWVRTAMLLGLVAIVLGARLHAAAWTPWSRRAFDPRGLGEVLRFGLPTSVQMALEVWAFGTATFMAGMLGDTPTAAHAVVMNFVSLTFMVPLGVSAAACTRVGNLIGEGRSRRADTAAWVSFAMGGGVMAVAAIVILATGPLVPSLYFSDASSGEGREIVLAATAVLPIAAAFQIFDGTQVVGCGILRGMGRTLPAAAINLVGYWLLALPLAYWMTFHRGLGLRGVWWGLAIGLAIVAAALLIWVRLRGPSRDSATISGR